MRKLFVLFLLLTSGLNLNAQKEFNYKSYFHSDSAQVFSWDATLNDWILNSSQLYYYNEEGKLNLVVERSLISGSYLSKSESLYNENGLLSLQTNYSWNGAWVPAGKIMITYDQNNKTSEIMIQVNNSGNWVNNRWQKNYKYDLEGRLTEFQMFYWSNNAWSLPTTDNSTYDEQGRLIKRVALYSTGNTDYQVIFNYDSIGLRSEMYAQYPSGSVWFNWWLINYQYNDCGSQITQVQYTGILTNWIPQTKTVSYSSFNSEAYPGKKIAVCHNGNTIYISKSALKAHLAHGDCIGECTVEKKSERQECKENKVPGKPPFTIYPNPAKEKVTIKFDKDEIIDSKRVEMSDFDGKLLKSFIIKDNGDLTIYRNNLHSGKYNIKLVGKNVYSAVVIFE